MRLFVAINGWAWREQPDIDDAERAVFGIAGGEVDEASAASWLRRFLVPPSPDDAPERP